jgi:AmiR/NasT family two-component response regulator
MSSQRRPADGVADPAERVRELEKALETRIVIARAEGIIMERYEMQPDAAFAVLRRIATRAGVPVKDVAEHLVASRTLPRYELR